MNAKKALDLLHAHHYYVPCEYVLSKAGGGTTIKTDCEDVCMVNDVGDGEYEKCELTVGGPKSYIWIMLTLYLFTIFFYDIQKCLQYGFSDDDNTHMADLGDEDDIINTADDDIYVKSYKNANRQQSIAFAAKMSAIPTGVSMDVNDLDGVRKMSIRKMSIRKRSLVPSNIAISLRRNSELRKASVYRANMALKTERANSVLSVGELDLKVKFDDSTELAPLPPSKSVGFASDVKDDIESEGEAYTKKFNRKATGIPDIEGKANTCNSESPIFYIFRGKRD